jgi:hypothetical protein
MRLSNVSLLLLSALCVVLLSGCQKLGPASVRVGMPAYNIAINETRQQLLLLNIVRMRYSERPYLMEVSNIFAAPNYTAGANLGSTFGSSFDNFGTAGAELSYSEAPVIVYTPVGGEQLLRRLLQPVDLDTLDMLTRAGWDMDRILRLCVQEINHVWNADSATGPMSSSTTPDYETFRRVARTLNELESKRLITFPAPHYEDGHFDSTDIPGQPDQVLVHSMIIDTAAKQRPEVRQLMTDLNLDPQADSYYITNGQINAPGRTIRITTRPLMTTMLYLSRGVQVPQKDLDNGVVHVTLGKDGEPFDWRHISEELFTIESSASKPQDAFLAVQYRDHWFYIRDNDVITKDTFVLFETLLALRAGEVPQSNTPLTLPLR